jgi:CHAD domain-containing protein
MKKKARKEKPPRWNPRQSAASSAKAVLPEIAQTYFTAGQKIAAAARPPADDLHAFRLATKHFRYTMEMFIPMYGPGLESRLQRVRRIQQVLGEIQDCYTVRLLAPAAKHRGINQWLNRRAAQKKAEFQKLWREEFPPETAGNWVTYLQRYAKESAK